MSANHDLVLYYRPTCPFCIRVTDFMRSRGIEIPLRNISIDSEAARTLVSVGGKQQVRACSSTASRSTNQAISSLGSMPTSKLIPHRKTYVHCRRTKAYRGTCLIQTGSSP